MASSLGRGWERGRDKHTMAQRDFVYFDFTSLWSQSQAFAHVIEELLEQQKGFKRVFVMYVPAVQTCPMMTSATSDAGVLPRVKTSRMTMAPSSCALSELRHPFKFPIGVLPAATITTSELLYPELAAIVKAARLQSSLGTSLELYVPLYMTWYSKLRIPLFWHTCGLKFSSANKKQETRNMASQVDHVRSIVCIQSFPFSVSINFIFGHWHFLLRT